FPSSPEAHLIVVNRSEGGAAREWVVSVDDQIFAAQPLDDGTPIVLPVIATPAAGFPVIAMAALQPQLGDPIKAQFFAATRSKIFRLFLDPLEHWQVDEVNVRAVDDFVRFWVT